MTNEEAIENLKGCVCGYEVGKDGKPNGNVTADLTQETIDMAIKALEKHTEERTKTHECDCISRETHVRDCIEALPPVTSGTYHS